VTGFYGGNAAKAEKELVETSLLFDGAWYVAAYPEAISKFISPAEHYLQVGAGEGRNPGPYFDTSWYLKSNPDVANADINPLVHYLRHGRAEGRLPRPNVAADFEAKLWGGFSEPAEAELWRIFRGSGDTLPDVQSYAQWALARWYAYRGEWAKAVEMLSSRRRSDLFEIPAFPGRVLLKADCLLHLGKAREAQELLTTAISESGELADYCLAYANTYLSEPAVGPLDSDAERLAWINRVFLAARVLPLKKARPAESLCLDNIVAPGGRRIHGLFLPKISVILPLYNAERTVLTALESILQQTWRNLEVVVVDDGSSDGSADVVRSVARRDKRVVIVRHAQNMGGYAARNTGLRHARGKFITTHDSDDWSHPQKLELQARALIAQPELAGVLTHWVRADPQLRFGRWRMEDRLIHRSMSSFMFRRSVPERIGGWDRVKVNADTEYLLRVLRVFGDSSVTAIRPEVPLAFGRLADGSLTRHRATHLRTQFFGLRREYHEAAMWWHRHTPADELKLPLDTSLRPFPVPRQILQEPRDVLEFDMLLVADLGGGLASTSRLCRRISKMAGEGARVALFHWPDYSRDKLATVDDAIRALAAARQATILVPGESVVARTVCVCGGQFLQFRIDEVPAVRFERLVVEAAPELLADRNALEVAKQNLLGSFGMEGDWVSVDAAEVNGRA